MGDLAAAAGFQIESFGKLPLLHYIVAVRPQASRLEAKRMRDPHDTPLKAPRG